MPLLKITGFINLADQPFALVVGEYGAEVWPCSAARAGKVIPTGGWRPEFLSKNFRSSLYNNSPMP